MINDNVEWYDDKWWMINDNDEWSMIMINDE